jgi:probable F420-dependent oxidoreductase
MSTARLCINLTGLEYFEGGVAGVLDFARAADAAGVEQLTVSEHVAMGPEIVGYPYGRYPSTPDALWFEPVTLLSAVAAVTRRARLSTSILIGPLRPAVLLAKQLASLDQISGGRLEVGLGTGWQRAEYEACGVPFDGRLQLLDEQVQAMRALWSGAPATFTGERIRFDDLYSLPHPLQPGGVPIWFGLAPSPANIARMATYGAGWAPWFGLPSGDASKDVSREAALLRIAQGRSRIHAALQERKRDPAGFAIRTMPEPVLGANSFNLDATIESARDYITAGATHLEFAPGLFCQSADALPKVLDAMLTLQN